MEINLLSTIENQKPNNAAEKSYLKRVFISQIMKELEKNFEFTIKEKNEKGRRTFTSKVRIINDMDDDD